MKKILLLLCLGMAMLAHAQRQSNIWLGGRTGGDSLSNRWFMLDFGDSIPAPQETHLAFDFHLGSSVLCDTAGQLLCYTNGLSVANGRHQMVANGDSIGADTYMMNGYRENGEGIHAISSVLMLPQPLSDSIVFIFHVSIDTLFIPFTQARTFGYNAPYLHLSTLNLRRAAGRGELTQKNELLRSGLLISSIAATRHSNGRDWWVLSGDRWSHRYVRWLVDPQGVHGPYIQEINTPDFPLVDSLRGGVESNMIFSNDGNRLVRMDDFADIEVYDFDRCTGLLTPRQRFWPVQGEIDMQHLPPVLVWAKIALSPSGRYLYTYTGYTLAQYDLDATNIKSSETVLLVTDRAEFYAHGNLDAAEWGFLYTAPDGRIYSSSAEFWRDTVTFDPTVSYCRVNAILSPDSAGIACTPEVPHWKAFYPFADAIYWMPNTPNHPNYRLGALPGTACDSLGLPAWYAGPIERVDTTVGVEPALPEALEGNAIKLYPNPAREKATVTLPTQTSGTLQLVSATGVVLNSLYFSGQQVSLDLTGVPTGVYSVRVHTREGTMHTAKLVLLP